MFQPLQILSLSLLAEGVHISGASQLTSIRTWTVREGTDRQTERGQGGGQGKQSVEGMVVSSHLRG